MFLLYIKSNNNKKLIEKASNKEDLIDQAAYLATKAKYDEITVEDEKGFIWYSESIGILYTPTSIHDLTKVSVEEYYNNG